MAEHQEEIDRVKTQIADTTEKADTYLTQLTTKVEKYQQKHENAQPASEYLKKALDASRSATQKLKTRGQDLSEKSVPAAMENLQSVQKSLERLKTQAAEYDDHYAGSKGKQGVETLHGLVNAGRQCATDALELVSEQLTKLWQALGNAVDQAKLGTQVAVGEATILAEKGDEKLDVSGKSAGIVEKVIDLDERMGVSKSAAKVDETVTGGLGGRMVASGMEMARESVEYISGTLQKAKITAKESETAQAVETKAAEETVQVKETFVDLTYDAEEQAEQAATKAGEKVEQAKSMVVGEEKSGSSSSSSSSESAVDAAKAKGEAAAETVEEMTAKAKEKGKQAMSSAQVEAGQTKSAAQEKTEESKSDAKDKTEAAHEKTEKAESAAQEKIEETKRAAKEKTEKAKAKGSGVQKRGGNK